MPRLYVFITDNGEKCKGRTIYATEGGFMGNIRDAPNRGTEKHNKISKEERAWKEIQSKESS